MIEIPRIYAFCELAECLNFTEAAERLFTTQSSLSKTIARFEETVQCQLFTRTNRTVELTPAGKYLYKYFKNMTGEMRHAIEVARMYNTGVVGQLEIAACANSFTIPAPMQLLCMFKGENPGVNVIFQSPNMQEARNDLISNKFDALITRRGEVVGLPSCNFATITSCKPAFYISERHPVFEKTDNPTLADMAEYGFVTMMPNISPRVHYNTFEYCRLHGFTPGDIKYVNRIAEMHAEVAVNQRVGILDEFDLHGHYGFYSATIESVPDVEIVVAWNIANTNPVLPQFIEYIMEHHDEV